MADEDESILREVDQELAEDQQWANFRKHTPAIVGGALAIVLGVAGWQIYSFQRESAAKVASLEFQNALDLLAEDEIEGRTALSALSEDNGAYDDLAQFQAAASYARSGERLRAMQIFQDIADDGSAPKIMQELATIRAAHLALTDGRDSTLAILSGLQNSDSAFSSHAREIEGLAALRAKDFETALSLFNALSIDFSAPEGLRRRASEYLALAKSGKAGVNITGRADVEDILETLGGVNPDAPVPNLGIDAISGPIEKDQAEGDPVDAGSVAESSIEGAVEAIDTEGNISGDPVADTADLIDAASNAAETAVDNAATAITGIQEQGQDAVEALVVDSNDGEDVNSAGADDHTGQDHEEDDPGAETTANEEVE